MYQLFGNRAYVEFKTTAGLFAPMSLALLKERLKAIGKQTHLLPLLTNSFVNPYPSDPCTKKIIPGNQQ